MFITNILHSTDNDDALRLKVEEAMAVYDEYVKNQSATGESEGPNGTENKDPTAAQAKTAEA